MNRITIGNLVMSFIMTMFGVYDVRHELVGYGMVELWVGGGCFVAALHSASKKRATTINRVGIRSGDDGVEVDHWRHGVNNSGSSVFSDDLPDSR